MLRKGEIATTPSGGRVDVLVPSFDPEQPYQGCPVMPRGATDPVPGDPCWIDFDEDDTAVVVCWEPA